jgi:hypothetical protein
MIFKTPSQRRNGRAFSSLTARGGGLPMGVSKARLCITGTLPLKIVHLLPEVQTLLTVYRLHSL